MNYWPQQLNFAVWCATTGCSISSRLLFEDENFSRIPKTDGELRLPKQVRSFLWFHVYFTVRRILHELGIIQNSVALPGDDAFDQRRILMKSHPIKDCAMCLGFLRVQISDFIMG